MQMRIFNYVSYFFPSSWGLRQHGNTRSCRLRNKKNVEKTALNHFLRLQDVLIFRIYKIANSKRVSWAALFSSKKFHEPSQCFQSALQFWLGKWIRIICIREKFHFTTRRKAADGFVASFSCFGGLKSSMKTWRDNWRGDTKVRQFA